MKFFRGFFSAHNQGYHAGCQAYSLRSIQRRSVLRYAISGFSFFVFFDTDQGGQQRFIVEFRHNLNINAA
ncbi:MAG: hypothetical protein D3914_11380 [Candidatus Electrothrix sp. LOE2]|nr:hypothetical protein [Candidatus Electrothrix sp. LOE2]